MGVAKMKISKILFAVCLFQIVSTTSLMAAPTVLIQQGLYQVNPGGEFKATILDGGTSGLATGYQFQTFCVEIGETLSFGSQYGFGVNEGAVNGGVGGQTSPNYDPLDSRTAWLYNEFTKGTAGALNGMYDFNGAANARKSDAVQLQNAFWFLEGDLASLTSGSEAEQYVALAELSDWYADGTIGDIRIMNLYNSNGSIAQDVLVKTLPVPAPGALLLSAMGTMCVGYFRRLRAA